MPWTVQFASVNHSSLLLLFGETAYCSFEKQQQKKKDKWLEISGQALELTGSADAIKLVLEMISVNFYPKSIIFFLKHWKCHTYFMTKTAYI